MAAAARLERLSKLVQADLDALPDKTVSLELDDDQTLPKQPRQSPDNSKQTAIDTNITSKFDLTLKESSERRFVWLHNALSSYKAKNMTTALAKLPEANKLPVTDRQRGDLVSPQHQFSPVQAFAKYPYKFCDKTHMQDIASAFFDHGKFWEREWDLYYIWDIELDMRPLILIRDKQVEALLSEINSHLNLRLKITDQQREEGLVARFPDHPRCLPRYLGRSHSREEYDNMIDNVPSAAFRAPDEPAHKSLEGGTLEDFKQLMEELWDVQKAKNKATKEKKQQERLGKQKSMADQFKRTQRYLALRPSLQGGEIASGLLEAIDPASVAPYTFDQSVVFVCVDVEAYERAHHKITEVGVATLDTRDLIGVAPGVDGVVWRKEIRARHFRINEHRHLVNSDFVAGHPDKFRFGESTFVPLKEAAQEVAACFHAPFGASREDPAIMTRNMDSDEKRNIIFLGHDTLGDVKFLQQLGYDPMKVENIVEALDTAVMYRVWRREQQATGLGRILRAFDINGYYLHNAGNDAVFTMQVMLAICVREATIRGSPEQDIMRSEEIAARLAAAAGEAQERVNSEEEGWSHTDGGGDGGQPVPLASVDMPKTIPAQANPQSVPQYNDSYNTRGRGAGHAGRSRGSQAFRSVAASDSYRGGQSRILHGRSERADHADHRGRGRGQTGRRGGSQGRDRGRGRGRGPTLFDPNAPRGS